MNKPGGEAECKGGVSYSCRGVRWRGKWGYEGSFWLGSPAEQYTLHDIGGRGLHDGILHGGTTVPNTPYFYIPRSRHNSSDHYFVFLLKAELGMGMDLRKQGTSEAVRGGRITLCRSVRR